MRAPTLPSEGHCRCGRVRVRITKPPLITAACHCTGCQRMSSSAYSLTAAIPADGFEVSQGETVVGGLHGEEVKHHFCAWCMTWVFTRPTAVDWFVNLRPTLLEDFELVRAFHRDLHQREAALGLGPGGPQLREIPRAKRLPGPHRRLRQMGGGRLNSRDA